MAIAWRIELLGGLRAQRMQPLPTGTQAPDASQILDRFRSRKAGALFAFLAYFPRQHARDVVTELLWPGHDPQRSRQHLRVLLSSLRHDLEGGASSDSDSPLSDSLLISDRNSVGLNPQAITTDVSDFEAALQAASQVTSRASQNAHLTRAVGIYGGTLLPGFYEEWVVPEAHRLEELYFAALRRLVSGMEKDGDLEGSLHFARRGISVNALREDIGRDVMRLYAATGQPALAVRHYRELEHTLQRDLSLVPGVQTRELIRRIEREARRPGGQDVAHTAPEVAAPEVAHTASRHALELSTVGNRLHATKSELSLSSVGEGFKVREGSNLPLQWTRFFGRAAEIARVRQLLGNGERLVTLTGPGGSGKTRLALEVVRLLLEQHGEQEPEQEPKAGALWFVPLVDVADAQLLAGQIANAMRLPRAPQLSPLAQVTQALGSRVAPLLVLDNFEHLLPEGAALIQEVLARVPQLRIIVTSRQELQIMSERSFSVPPLPVPEGHLLPHALLQVASVQLFCDRARAVRPSFRVTGHNASAIAALCARLEGLPLAVELCAARAGDLSPAKMLERLAQRLDFLTEQPPASTYRHPTLRAALEWSYTLLWPQLQHFFTRLCVFRGGCTPEAAATIAQEPHAAHFLHQLRVASLTTSHEMNGEARFFLLETVRDFAWEHLPSHEATALSRLHAEFYAALAQSAASHLKGPHQGEWLDRLEVEHDNLRAALEWAEKHDTDLCWRMVGALGRFWLARGYYGEGRTWIQSVLRQNQVHSLSSDSMDSPAPVDSPARMEMLKVEAELAWHSGDFAAALAIHESRLASARAIGDRRAEADATHCLGYAAAQMGDFERARPLFEHSLTLSRELKDDELLSEALFQAISEAAASGDFARLHQLEKEAIPLSRRLGDTRQTAFLLNIIGFSDLLEGDLTRARPLLEESLTLSESVGEKWHTNRVWWTLGHLARSEGDFALARSHFDRALLELREWGCLWPLPYHLEPRAYMNIAEGNYERAARLLGAAEGLRETMRHALHPVLRPEYERCRASLSANLDAAKLEVAWNVGRALSWDAATALALDETL